MVLVKGLKNVLKKVTSLEAGRQATLTIWFPDAISQRNEVIKANKKPQCLVVKRFYLPDTNVQLPWGVG